MGLHAIDSTGNLQKQAGLSSAGQKLDTELTQGPSAHVSSQRCTFEVCLLMQGSSLPRSSPRAPDGRPQRQRWVWPHMNDKRTYRILHPASCWLISLWACQSPKRQEHICFDEKVMKMLCLAGRSEAAHCDFGFETIAVQLRARGLRFCFFAACADSRLGVKAAHQAATSKEPLSKTTDRNRHPSPGK